MTNNIISVDYMKNEEMAIFHTVMQKKKEEADSLIDSLLGAVGYVGIADEVIKGIQPKYVVRLGEEAAKQLKKGAKFITDKKGNMHAQIRGVDGKFGPKLPIEKEMTGLDVNDISNALQMKAIEQKLAEIQKTLEDISEDIDSIIKGQQNDRIGLFYSGMSIYKDSLSVQDETLKKLLNAQAIKTLSDAYFQMKQNMLTDMEYLIDKKYKKHKGNSVEEIKSKMNSIDQCFEVLYKATILKAAIYYDNNETETMIKALDEYGSLIEKSVIPNVKRLSQYEVHDTYLQSGTWEQRAQSLVQLSQIKDMLCCSNEFSITMEE